MVAGVGESRPAVEADNFESSFNLSHPPERLFPPLFTPPFSTHLYSLPRAPLFSAFDRPLSLRAAVSRRDILLQRRVQSAERDILLRR